MSMLADLVEVVIGVDTHKHTHTAAVVQAATGAVLARVAVSADPDGYTELDALAEQHSGLRAWALEGSGGYGAGLARHLAGHGELVIELDRPVRPKRRAGAKSDPIDAVRAARDALARTQLAQPKTGAERAALQMHLTARRAAVEAAADAQRQLHALVVTAPERARARFRGQSTRLMITTAGGLRLPGPRTPNSSPRSRSCAPWPAASGSSRPRRSSTSAPSGPWSAAGARTFSSCPESARSWPPPC